MLTAVPKGIFSWNFDVLENGSLIAELRLAWYREKGTLTIRGVAFEIGREGLVSGDFYLRKGGVTVASATKPSALRRSFEVRCNNTDYVLEAASLFVRRFTLSRDGREVGSISPAHAFTRRAVIDLPAVLSVEVRVFITWLVLILWKRQQESD